MRLGLCSDSDILSSVAFQNIAGHFQRKGAKPAKKGFKENNIEKECGESNRSCKDPIDARNHGSCFIDFGRLYTRHLESKFDLSQRSMLSNKISRPDEACIKSYSR